MLPHIARERTSTCDIKLQGDFVTVGDIEHFILKHECAISCVVKLYDLRGKEVAKDALVKNVNWGEVVLFSVTPTTKDMAKLRLEVANYIHRSYGTLKGYGGCGPNTIGVVVSCEEAEGEGGGELLKELPRCLYGVPIIVEVLTQPSLF